MDVNGFITDIIPIRNAELKGYLKQVCRIDVFRRGDHLNEIGEKDRYVRFLIQGAVRGYIVDSQGKETTTCFLVRTGEVIAGSRMMDGSASEIGFIAVKESEIFSVPVEAILDLWSKYSEIANLYVYILAKCVSIHWECRKMLYLKSARERYEWFLKNNPGLIDCVRHTDIASFLNITPVTLSRIRHEDKENAKTLSKNR